MAITGNDVVNELLDLGDALISYLLIPPNTVIWCIFLPLGLSPAR